MVNYCNLRFSDLIVGRFSENGIHHKYIMLDAIGCQKNRQYILAVYHIIDYTFWQPRRVIYMLILQKIGIEIDFLVMARKVSNE